MTKTELLELISNGESSGIEFRRDDIRPEQLAKEEDDGTISGLRRPAPEAWVMDTVFGRYVHPLIIPFYEEVQMEPGLRIAVISLTQGIAKPYVVRWEGSEDIYVRIGSISRRASREQQARLFAAGGMLQTELLPVSGTGLEDLDMDRLQDYLRHIIQDPETPTDQEEWERRLCGMGFLTERNGDKPVCTLSGLVLFGHRPRRVLRQAGVRWMVFRDRDMDYTAADDVILHPLVGLWRVRRGSRQLDAGGLMEQSLDRMRPFVSGDASELSCGVRRDRRWLYPREALREALVNALANRRLDTRRGRRGSALRGPLGDRESGGAPQLHDHGKDAGRAAVRPQSADRGGIAGLWVRGCARDGSQNQDHSAAETAQRYAPRPRSDGRLSIGKDASRHRMSVHEQNEES